MSGVLGSCSVPHVDKRNFRHLVVDEFERLLGNLRAADDINYPCILEFHNTRGDNIRSRKRRKPWRRLTVFSRTMFHYIRQSSVFETTRRIPIEPYCRKGLNFHITLVKTVKRFAGMI
jgi:hypothetical protein